MSSSGFQKTLQNFRTLVAFLTGRHMCIIYKQTVNYTSSPYKPRFIGFLQHLPDRSTPLFRGHPQRRVVRSCVIYELVTSTKLAFLIKPSDSNCKYSLKPSEFHLKDPRPPPPGPCYRNSSSKNPTSLALRTPKAVRRWV